MAGPDYDPATTGGWWTTTPAESIWACTGSSNSRLIIPYTMGGDACCTDFADTQLDSALPPPLAARGMTQQEWDGIVAGSQAAQKSTVGLCGGVLMLLTVILIPIYCLVVSNYHTHFDLWLQQLNSVHLQPRGMLARLQRATTGHGKYKHHRQWLAIALTPDESEQLAAEPASWVRRGDGIFQSDPHFIPNPGPCPCLS